MRIPHVTSALLLALATTSTATAESITSFWDPAAFISRISPDATLGSLESIRILPIKGATPQPPIAGSVSILHTPSAKDIEEGFSLPGPDGTLIRFDFTIGEFNIEADSQFLAFGLTSPSTPSGSANVKNADTGELLGQVIDMDRPKLFAFEADPGHKLPPINVQFFGKSIFLDGVVTASNPLVAIPEPESAFILAISLAVSLLWSQKMWRAQKQGT